MEVEVLGFQRPRDGGKSLYICGIPSCLSREEKWAALHGEFSRHGLVYEISLPLSPANQELIDHDVAEPAVAVGQQSPASETEYGFVTFYSRLDAKNALQNIQKNPISISNHSLKVELARPRNKPHPPATPTLYLSKCVELCNHFIGFNGWSLHIVSMENIQEQREGGGEVWVGVRCSVGVTLRGCGDRESRGVGEWRGEEEGGGMSNRLKTRRLARKISFARACEDAFSNILIILIPGKPPVPMIVEKSEDHVRQLMGEFDNTCPPVTVLPCQPDDSSILQECPW